MSPGRGGSAARPRFRGGDGLGEHDAAPVFSALGDETRLQLVSRLCREGPLSITRLSEGTTVTRQAVTKHLHALQDAGLAHGARQGREQVWSLETKRLEFARRYLDDVSAQWDVVIGRLKDFVEG
jgi:DNA-binding transcriptional ArsR family regulator